MSATSTEPKVTSDGRLFYCKTLDQWFSIEAIEADPHLSLQEDETVKFSPSADKEASVA
ncbi:MAG: hypothetical protein WC250_02090 [Candidatus Paceibacterota bacterium]|jgi:hypothetical protein